jgi:hypothetical protein
MAFMVWVFLVLVLTSSYQATPYLSLVTDYCANPEWLMRTAVQAQLVICGSSNNLSFLIACFVTCGFFFILVLNRSESLTASAYLYMCLLVIVSVLFIFTTSIALMFVYFECLLLLAVALLKLTSKSERIGEAISEMFM